MFVRFNDTHVPACASSSRLFVASCRSRSFSSFVSNFSRNAAAWSAACGRFTAFWSVSKPFENRLMLYVEVVTILDT